jgi:uncharacterized protein YdbL (DUF1318 family)
MKRMIGSLALTFSVLLLLGAQDEEEMKHRIEARATKIDALLKDCVVREGDAGLLVPAKTLDADQSAVLNNENQDRKAVFAIVAKKSHTKVEDVALMFARRAQRRSPNTVQGCGGGGPCQLIPTENADIAKLLQYMKQGMTYAATKHYENASSEFEQALKIDKNFLGLNLNSGSALIALKKYSEAEAALKQELKLVGCLEGVPAESLGRYDYMIEVSERDPAKKETAKAAEFRLQMGKVKSISEYNLACVYSREGRLSDSTSMLREAVKDGYSDGSQIASDANLAAVRGTPDYKEILTMVKDAKR